MTIWMTSVKAWIKALCYLIKNKTDCNLSTLIQFVFSAFIYYKGNHSTASLLLSYTCTDEMEVVFSIHCRQGQLHSYKHLTGHNSDQLGWSKMFQVHRFYREHLDNRVLQANHWIPWFQDILECQLDQQDQLDHQDRLDQVLHCILERRAYLEIQWDRLFIRFKDSEVTKGEFVPSPWGDLLQKKVLFSALFCFSIVYD